MTTGKTYIFENGLRKVQPFFHKSEIHAKQRWVGRTLCDVMKNELNESPTIIRQEIANNLIYIWTNHGKRKNLQERLEGWDVLKDRPIDRFDVIHIHRHRHEPSVPDWAGTSNIVSIDECRGALSNYPSQLKTNLKIVFESSDLLVVSKPSGIPTHPTGNYYYNTITEILKFDLNLDNIWPCHRLDKVTSGILILAKNKQTSIDYQLILTNEKASTKKLYYARVRGKFPEQEVMVNCPVFSVNSCGAFLNPSNASEIPSNSTTIFKSVKYNEPLNESIVVCQPLTGKMHQIRIHLRNMGYPIVDDFKYNPEAKQLPNQMIMKITNDLEIMLYERLFEKYPQFKEFLRVDKSVVSTSACIDVTAITKWNNDSIILQQVDLIKQKRAIWFADLRNTVNMTCDICHRDLLDTDKDFSDLSIMLHAFKYQYNGTTSFDFEDTPPQWCTF
jgi:pseudouridylate synthase